MPTYSLRGIEVQFPHEAYQCQVRTPPCCSELSRPVRIVFLPHIQAMIALQKLTMLLRPAARLHGQSYSSTSGGDLPCPPPFEYHTLIPSMPFLH